MGYFVQYNKNTGQIFGAVQTDRKPIIRADDPERSQVEFKTYIDIHGKRINLETLQMEDCPLYLKAVHNDKIMSQLREIDEKRVRAFSDFHLTGDKTRLQELEEQAAVLRPQLIKD